MKFINVTSDQNLVFDECQRPQLLDYEVLIRVAAIGVNRADLLQRQGKYPPPKGESEILGIEVSGIIEQCGNSVQGWKIGDAVCSIVPGGGYAEFVKVKARHLLAKPNNLSFIDAAGIAETFLTAYQALFYCANVKQNSNVLIHAGASGVGCAAIQLAKQHNCSVAVTVGSEVKGDFCCDIGADTYVNYNTQDMLILKQQSKFAQGFDFILDVVSGDYLNRDIKLCSTDATVVLLSILGGRYADSVDIAKLLQKRISIIASTLRNRSDDYKATLISNFSQSMLPLFDEGKLSATIDTVLPWSKVGEAHSILGNNQNIGKVILEIV